MITEAILGFFVKTVGFFVAPIFDKAFDFLHIGSDAARLYIPSPLFLIVYTYTTYAVFLTPIALLWWVWRQVKA